MSCEENVAWLASILAVAHHFVYLRCRLITTISDRLNGSWSYNPTKTVISLTLSMSLSSVPCPGPSSTSWQFDGWPLFVQSESTHTANSYSRIKECLIRREWLAGSFTSPKTWLTSGEVMKSPSFLSKRIPLHVVALPGSKKVSVCRQSQADLTKLGWRRHSLM